MSKIIDLRPDHMKHNRKPYTAWRRFLAWVGFITIIFGIPIALYFIAWAHSFLSNNL